jgi:hypothetical protein
LQYCKVIELPATTQFNTHQCLFAQAGVVRAELVRQDQATAMLMLLLLLLLPLLLPQPLPFVE